MSPAKPVRPTYWRRVRDSNPQGLSDPDGFQDRVLIRPDTRHIGSFLISDTYTTEPTIAQRVSRVYLAL